MASHYEATLQRDIDLIRSKVLEMANLAGKALKDSLKAVVERNPQAALPSLPLTLPTQGRQVEKPQRAPPQFAPRDHRVSPGGKLGRGVWGFYRLPAQFRQVRAGRLRVQQIPQGVGGVIAPFAGFFVGVNFKDVFGAVGVVLKGRDAP